MCQSKGPVTGHSPRVAKAFEDSVTRWGRSYELSGEVERGLHGDETQMRSSAITFSFLTTRRGRPVALGGL